jgi:subtilisin family serine protease
MNTRFGAVRRAVVCLLPALLALVASAADVRVYVQFAPGQKAAAQSAAAQAGARTHHEFDNLNALALSLPEQARTALEHNPAITLVEDDPVRGFLSQTVPYGVTMVQAPDAVAAGGTGSGIKVGVIDSGVFTGHEDLQGVTITGEPDYGANDERTWYRDYLSHGTHVVGTIAAANNSLGVLGISPGAVSIHMVKVFGDTGNWVYSSDLLSAARAAANKGAKIISMSLGGGRSSVTERSGMDDLYNNRGVLLVAAAGNDGTTAVSYPAGYASVISVAAIDSNKTVASFSQKNSDVELAAPGVGVLSTVSYLDSTSVAVNGTTYAANHIENSARGTVSASLVYGGLGTATNSAWSGKVVLLDRGTNSFYDKVHNVQLSGGVACIVANNVSGNFLGTLGDGNSSTIPAVSVSQEDGAVLQGAQGSTATVSTAIQQNTSGYEYFDGTSMATPHVSGVAALIWSKYPGATNAQVRQALTSSAQDLGTAGRDTSYGYGLVQAKAALDALAALNPGSGSTDTTAPVISNVAGTVTNSKNGSFQITWTTNEPATSDVQINGTLYSDSTLTTNHKRTFRGTRGATYTYTVISTDAAGNTASSGPYTIQL